MVYDVYIESTHQSSCPRIVRYYNQRAALTLFPEGGFGEQAEELGPHSNVSGPRLVLLSGVAAAPDQVFAWFAQATQLNRTSPRFFCFDVQTAACASRAELVAALAALPPPKGGVRLQCLPRSLDTELAASLPETWRVHPVRFDSVLSVLEHAGRLRWSLLPAGTLWRTPPQRQAARGCSRAVHKLQEALAALRRAGGGLGPVRFGTAIDLGAAPGGWTAHLATVAERVIAVDPAALAPEVAALPNVTHLRKQSVAALDDIRRLAPGGADLLVCDMNIVPPEVMPLVAQLLPVLRPGAQVVVTLKFVGLGRDRACALAACDAALQPLARTEACLWLLANTIYERTLLARRV